MSFGEALRTIGEAVRAVRVESARQAGVPLTSSR